jgi:hypothetical protein
MIMTVVMNATGIRWLWANEQQSDLMTCMTKTCKQGRSEAKFNWSINRQPTI